MSGVALRHALDGDLLTRVSDLRSLPVIPGNDYGAMLCANNDLADAVGDATDRLERAIDRIVEARL